MAEQFPSATECVVIGGGIVGVTAALYLARAGVPVVLCEKGRVAAEQSSRNWGWVRKQGRDPRELPGAILAGRLWREIDEELPDETGFKVGGVAYLARDEAKLARYESWLQHSQAYQLDTRILSKSETDALVGQPGSPYLGALITPSDARAEPKKAVPAMARLARTSGALIHEGTAVRALDIAAGQVKGVVTEHGRIACNSVILAGGAWTSLLLRHHGIDLPQLKVRASVQRTGPAPLIAETAMGDDQACIRRREDGGYTVARSGTYTVDITPDSFRHFKHYWPVFRADYNDMKIRIGQPFLDAWRQSRRWSDDQVSPFEQVRTLDPEPDHALLDDVMTAAKMSFPQLAGVEVAERWAGMIDVMPDAVPVMDETEAIKGLCVATGFSGHGFGFGPAAGHLMAQWVRGQTPDVDMSPFRLKRFFEGKPLKPFDL